MSEYNDIYQKKVYNRMIIMTAKIRMRIGLPNFKKYFFLEV